MRKKIFFLMVFIISIHCWQSPKIMGQNIEFENENFKSDLNGLKVAVSDLFNGMELYRKKEFSGALPELLKANTFNPNNAELNLMIGDCYINSREKFLAKAWLEKSVQLDSKNYNFVYYLLGEAYQLDMDFDKALKTYAKFKPPADGRIAYEAKLRQNECKMGKAQMKTPVKVRIENIGTSINSAYSEYYPIISADESVMIFTSRRKNTTGGQKDPNDKDYFEDIYFSYKKDTVWSLSENIGIPINSATHDASVNLSADGQRLFIYKEDEKTGGNIYESLLEGDVWSKPNKLNSNINTKYQETSACISSDGKTLYFVSDKPGGIGGRDIYTSLLNDKGEWEKAVNIGATINTTDDEDGVFIHPDGTTLYFSSMGHKTMGGFDIFKSTLSRGKWSKAENLGYPINSADDDVSFIVSANGKNAYYSSTRKEGLGRRDIYRLTYLEDSINKVAEPLVTLVKGTVGTEKTDVPVEPFMEIVETTKGTVYCTVHSNSVTGKFLIPLPSDKSYQLNVKAKGYIPQSININALPTPGYSEILEKIILKKQE